MNKKPFKVGSVVVYNVGTNGAIGVIGRLRPAIFPENQIAKVHPCNGDDAFDVNTCYLKHVTDEIIAKFIKAETDKLNVTISNIRAAMEKNKS